MKTMLQVALVLLSFLLSVSARHSAVRGQRGDYVENENDTVRDLRRKGKKDKSKSKISLGGGFRFEGSCVICSSEFNDNKPAALKLEYKPEGRNSQFQAKNEATCRAGKYPPTAKLHVENKGGTTQSFEVETGKEFTLQGPFDENTYFSFYSTTHEDKFGNPDHLGGCTIQTSCSTPLVQGDLLGPFLILGGGDCSSD